MRLAGLAAAALAAALLAAAPAGRAQVAVPPLRARVTDLTGTLSAEQRAALERKLEAFEQAKGSQLAVLMVPTTRPEEIEQYSIRVFDQWKLGRKGVDDGALVLVAKDDRRMRIEVGRGLEGAIPDAYAKRIVDEEMAPRFRQGDFYGGLDAAADRLIKLAQGEPMPPPPRRAAPAQPGFSPETLFIAFIAVTVLARVLRSLLGRAVGSAVVGGAVGLLVHALVGVLAVSAVAALVAFMVSLAGVGGRYGRTGGWTTGGWGGGGFGGGGGGFGGGGGSSAGGGASGSW